MSTSTSDGQQAEKVHKCPYCQRRFESTDELTLHIVTRHSSQKGLPADVLKQIRQLREASGEEDE